MKIAVLGGGHGCYAAAADLAEAGHEVRLWRRDGAALAPVIEAGGIVLVDERGRREVAIAMATADSARRCAGAELIVVPSPAIAQADIARAMAPHLRTARWCSCRRAPSAASSWRGSSREQGSRADVAWAETGTLPYLARKLGPREVRVTIRAVRLPTGVYPARRAEEALAVIGRAYPCGAWLRRCPVGRADERRAGDPSAADGDERGAAAALRALGHPRRRHAAGGARRHRPARPGADRGARGARLRRAALSARRPLRQRPLDVRRRAQEARRLGRLARAHRPAHPSLRHRGHRARPRLPRLGGALVRRRCADRARPARGRPAASSAATCATARAPSKRSASPVSTAPALQQRLHDGE